MHRHIPRAAQGPAVFPLFSLLVKHLLLWRVTVHSWSGSVLAAGKVTVGFDGVNEITQRGTWGSDAEGRGSGRLPGWGVSTTTWVWGQEEKAEGTREWGEKMAGPRQEELEHDLEPHSLTCSNRVKDTGEILWPRRGKPGVKIEGKMEKEESERDRVVNKEGIWIWSEMGE